MSIDESAFRDGAGVGPRAAATGGAEASFSHVFASALREGGCAVVGLDAGPRELPIEEWVRDADASDHALLDLCEGPTIDIGCGPGRLTAALTERGEVALGIDVVHEAVGQTRARGGAAIRRSVFQAVPGEGRWRTAILADGNVGIGGDPVALLTRVVELIEDEGRVVVEVEAPGVEARTVWATLECGGVTSRPFRWSVLGLDDLAGVAADAGLRLAATHEVAERWFAVLDRAR